MLSLLLNSEHDHDFQILCLGAHSDDIEIGCGGTILKFTQKFPKLACSWIVFGAQGQRANEAKGSAKAFLEPVKEKFIDIQDFKDGFFPYEGAKIKTYFEQLKQKINPDVIFTHHRNDLHQDHRLICELTWNTFRNHMILEYEIPKFDGDLGSPNTFSIIDKDTCTTKIDFLFRFFISQLNKPWFTAETFSSLLRIRGMEIQSESGYAEAFYSRKAIIS